MAWLSVILAVLALGFLLFSGSLNIFWIIVILLSLYLLHHQRQRFMPTTRWQRYRNWRQK
jgi:hypothetical protein